MPPVPQVQPVVHTAVRAKAKAKARERTAKAKAKEANLDPTAALAKNAK